MRRSFFDEASDIWKHVAPPISRGVEPTSLAMHIDALRPPSVAGFDAQGQPGLCAAARVDDPELTEAELRALDEHLTRLSRG